MLPVLSKLAHKSAEKKDPSISRFNFSIGKTKDTKPPRAEVSSRSLDTAAVPTSYILPPDSGPIPNASSAPSLPLKEDYSIQIDEVQLAKADPAGNVRDKTRFSGKDPGLAKPSAVSVVGEPQKPDGSAHVMTSRTPQQDALNRDTVGLLREILHKDETPTCTIDEINQVFEDLLKVKPQMAERREKNEQRLKFLKCVDSYRNVISTGIQHHPEVTALVWAGTQALLMFAKNRYETLIGLEDAIETISLAIVKCQFYQAIYDFSLPDNSPVPAAQMYDHIWQILCENLPQLYAAVVKFAKKTKDYFAPERTVKKKMVMFAKSLFIPFCVEHQSLLEEIMAHEKNLRDLAQTRTMLQQICPAAIPDLPDIHVYMEGDQDRLYERLDEALGDSNRMKNIMDQILDEQQKESAKLCRTWLGAQDTQKTKDEYESNRRKRFEGTCEWLLKAEAFQHFTTEDEKRHLWVYGHPGSGKSVLAAYIVEQARKESSSKSQIILQYFCNAKDRPMAIDIVRNLAEQLLASPWCPALLGKLDTARTTSTEARCTYLMTMWGVFIDMIQSLPKYTEIIAVVDGIDCCPDIDELAGPLLRSCSETMGRLRFLITSRADWKLDMLRPAPEMLSCVMSPEEDITTVVSGKADLIQSDILRPYISEIKKQILRNSEGNFLYASLALDRFQSASAGEQAEWTSNQKIDQVLTSLAQPLYRMYTGILMQLDQERKDPLEPFRRKKILTLIAVHDDLGARLSSQTSTKETILGNMVSKRLFTSAGEANPQWQPMTFRLLALLCAFDQEDSTYVFTPDQVQRLCGPLVSLTDDGRVKLSNRVLKRFILKPQDEPALIHRSDTNKVSMQYRVGNVDAHAEAALCCVKAVHDQWQKLPKNAITGSHSLFHPTLYWVEHANIVTASKLHEDSQSVVIRRMNDAITGLLRDRQPCEAWVQAYPNQSQHFKFLTYGPRHQIVLAKWLGLSTAANDLTFDLVDQETGGTIWAAAKTGNVELLLFLIESSKGKLENTDEDGYTALQLAAKNGHAEAADLLLVSGADVNSNDSSMWPPVLLAAHYGHESVVSVLLKHNAVLSCRGKDGQTPLHAAVKGNYVGVVKALLGGEGIDVNSADKNDRTALFMAAKHNCRNICELLLQNPAINVNLSDNESRTPLFIAAHEDHDVIVKALLEHPDIDTNAADNFSRTPLFTAVDKEHSDSVKLLLARDDVDVNARGHDALRAGAKLAAGMVKAKVGAALNGSGRGEPELPIGSDGHTPLQFACKHGRGRGVVELLLADERTDVNCRDTGGRTALHMAASALHESKVAALLTHSKIEVEARNQYGETPLAKALESYSGGIIKMLIRHGASIYTKDNCGESPYSTAKGGNFFDKRYSKKLRKWQEELG